MYIPINAILNLSNILINQYFSDFWCSVIITERDDFDVIADKPIINFKFNRDEVQLSDFLLEVLELGCHGFFVHISNASVFFEIIEINVHKINHRFGRKRVIVLPLDYDTGKNNFEIRNLYESKSVSHIPDVIYLKPIISSYKSMEYNLNYKFAGLSENSIAYDFEIYAHKYVGVKNNSDAILMDQWFSRDCSFEFRTDLFPNKMANLKGKQLRVSTFNYLPSGLWWIDKKNTLHFDGTEARIVIEYCRWVNCTIELIHYEEELEWGELFENNTGVGMPGNVFHGRADLGFGSSCMWFHEYTFLDLSFPSLRTGITTIAPKPKLVKDFLVPYLPFTADVWIANFIVIFIATIMQHHFMLNVYRSKVSKGPKRILDKSPEHAKTDISIETLSNENINTNKHSSRYNKEVYKIKGKKRYNTSANNKVKQSKINLLMDSFLSIWDILLLQGGGYGGGNRGLALRNAMLFYCFFITNAYMCGLTSTLTMPRYTETFDTVGQIIKSNIKWGATQDAWVFSIRESTDKNLLKIRNKFVKKSASQLKDLWDDDQFAYAVERLQNGHFAIPEYITEAGINNRRLMGEDLYWDWYVALFRKSSAFRPLYDKFLNRLHQAGLPKAWEVQVVGKYLSNRRQQGVALSSSRPINEPTVLQLHHIQGLLLLWACLISVSLIAFISELIQYHYSAKKKLAL